MTHHIDKLVGERIKSVRLTQGLSQEELASKIGTSFQQLQKYESGKNRISASRLFDLAKAMGMPVSYFFAQNSKTTPLLDKSTATLVGRYSELPQERQQLVFKLIKELSNGST